MKALALVALLLLSGCYVHIRDERVVDAVGLAMFAGVFAGHVIEESRNPRPMPSLSRSLSPWVNTPPPAPMDPDRRVSVQDCSQPIDYTLGNIKCK
ncbi:MAG: hypothetical protein ACT4P4_04425 [Betaproteobacteria bacterium]